MTTEAGNALHNINARIQRLGNRPESIVLAAGLPIAPTVRKLAGKGELTVAEVISICRVINLPVEKIFAPRTEMRSCTNGKCIEAEHEWMNNRQINSCRLEAIEGDGFIVHGNLFEHGWEAWPDTDDLADGHKGIEQAKTFVKAFEAMQAVCDRLNGPELHRATEPGAPAFEEAFA